MSTLVLPELLERLSLELGELEVLLLNRHLVVQQLADEILLQTQVRNGELATVVITTSIGQLQGGVGSSDGLLDFFPVNLELLSLFEFFDVKRDDQSTQINPTNKCEFMGLNRWVGVVTYGLSKSFSTRIILPSASY